MTTAPINLESRNGEAVSTDVSKAVSNPFPDKPITLSGTPTITSGQGSISASGTTVTITPNNGFHGTITAQYKVLDSTGSESRAVTGTITVQVGSVVPAAPSGVSVTPVDADSARVSWTDGSANGSPITGYKVSVNGSEQSCSTSNCLINGLAPGQSYSIQVVSTNKYGDSEAATVSYQHNATAKTPAAPTLTAGSGKVTAARTEGDEPPRRPAPPVYRDGPSKMSEVDARSWSIDDVLDAVFFAIAAVATLWLAWLLIGSGWHLNAVLVVNSLLFWAVLAYLALPRLHQVLTWLYVPDYFIGRTRTPDGLLGDPVNLAVKGDEEDIHEAMIAAGWVRADPITLRSSWRIIVSSLLRRSYPAAPVSNLMLFGRKQSFAYQKEVEGNPAQRHHIRFWYCPPGWSLPGGGHVDWLAAATYDRAVGLSALTLQVTHKIDADIDIERNYVVDDVRWANEAAELEIWPDVFTSYHDKNGGGDRVVTDGALHVLDLNEVVPGSDAGLSLQQARLADHPARRRRASPTRR